MNFLNEYNKWKEKNLAKEQACLQQGFNFMFIIDFNYEKLKSLINNKIIK